MAVYQPCETKNIRDVIRKSFSCTILTKMYKIQVKPLLDRSQRGTRLSRPILAEVLTGIVTMLDRFSYLRKEIPWEKIHHIMVMIKKVYMEFVAPTQLDC